MYETHPIFIQPDDENVKVWRYMDFTKFISLIVTRKLYFARADRFDDPFEGSWPKINVDARKPLFKHLPEEDQRKRLEGFSYINKRFLRYHALNCWHENEYESAAMWKLYLKSDEGIAIQSTYKLLKNSILDNETVLIGKVKYIDFEKEFIDARNGFSAFLHKRKSFEHEREIRAIVTRFPPSVEDEPPSNCETLNLKIDTIFDGIPIKVDIKTLIQKIHVAPNTPTWLYDLVKEVLEKYGYDFEVIHSQMDSNPMF
ncbi:MAG: hypothetical protein HOO86_09025 [Bacteroidales bacterium]|nr:hypothetical protein [Bacteroidales bacterium]